MWKSEAEQFQAIVHHHEPGVEVMLVKRWFPHQYRAFVVRGGTRYEYQDLYHYWLERALVETLGRPWNGERE